MTAEVEPHELIDRTLELLRVRSRVATYSQIAAETKVPKDWIKSFATRGSADASFTRVAKLYEYLTGSKL